MSRHAHEWALRDPWIQANVFGPARAVLMVLADHANEAAGEAWPSMATIVAESGFANGTVGRALERLEHLGVVETLGYRQRARLRRLVVPSTSPAAGEEAAITGRRGLSADVPDLSQNGNGHGSTSPAPLPHVSHTSPALGDEPEPEPEPTAPPNPPEGGRQRDIARFGVECDQYAHAHGIPGGGEAVRQAVTYGKATGLSDVLAFAEQWFAAPVGEVAS